MTDRIRPDRRANTPVAATILIAVASSVLLFARLGHYALWDDEALTAMTSANVWHTGDTTVNVGEHNIMAYRNGLLVKNFRDRYTPPLQFYFIAPFVGLLGDSSFVCRLPMALCGAATVALILLWLWKTGPPPLVWWGAAFAILTNVSFFLFFRQCRYYGLATMLTTAAAFFYCTGRGRSSVIGLSAVLALLLATQYLNYAAAVGCLVVDYLIWGRKTRPLKRPDWLILILPQLVVGGIVCSIWNPVARQGGSAAYKSGSLISDRLHLFWWNWREMFQCDFVILPLLLICPLLFFIRFPRRPDAQMLTASAFGPRSWSLRAPGALVVYMAAISTFVPTAVAQASNAEVRYLAPAAPLCIGIAIVAVWGLVQLPRAVQSIVLAVSAMSTLLEPTPSPWPKVDAYRWKFGSSTPQWWWELINPIDEPYTPMIDWIRKNVPAGSSIYIEPGYMAYPLMQRCPDVTFAWQLTDPPRADFVNLPDIHFAGRVPPDYIIICGSEQSSGALIASSGTRGGYHYERVAQLPYYWKDLYRPELIWRSFRTVVPADDNSESIYILKRVKSSS